MGRLSVLPERALVVIIYGNGFFKANDFNAKSKNLEK